MASSPESPILTKSTRVAVVYGGLSSERPTSLITGKNCFEALQRLGYSNSVLIDADRDLAQRLIEEKVEVVFNGLHGKYGEDGCLQGMLELMGIPYTGCDHTSSAVSMDKAITKTMLVAEGLPFLPSVTIDLNERQSGELCQVINLTYPVMVKPLNEGSSIGMSKVDDKGALKEALAEAGKYSSRILIEEFRKSKSVTVGVIEVDGKNVVTPLLELKPTKSEWYDLEAKYTKGLTEFILPASVDEATSKAMQETSLKAHKILGCHGVSRTDFVVTEDNKFYILETNTTPGMTALSDLPMQAEHIGINYDALVECILKTAFSRNKVGKKASVKA